MIKKLMNVFFSKTFFIYLLFGGVATIIDWSAFAFGTYSLGMNYVLAVTISFSLGSITNFTLNKYLNFKNRYKRVHIQFLLYLVIAVIGLVFTIFFMWIMIEGMLIDKFLARVITTAIVLVYNFLGHKYVTFKLLR